MAWIVLFVVLQCVFIIGGILFFNAYLRKQIKKDAEQKSAIDQSYIEAEKTRAVDEDLGKN
jgi:uncharacterized protein YneF (UPF0154 family)